MTGQLGILYLSLRLSPFGVRRQHGWTCSRRPLGRRALTAAAGPQWRPAGSPFFWLLIRPPGVCVEHVCAAERSFGSHRRRKQKNKETWRHMEVTKATTHPLATDIAEVPRTGHAPRRRVCLVPLLRRQRPAFSSDTFLQQNTISHRIGNRAKKHVILACNLSSQFLSSCREAPNFSVTGMMLLSAPLTKLVEFFAL